MMSEKTNQTCRVHNYDRNRRHEEHQIFSSYKNSNNDEDRWHTSSQDAFSRPPIQKLSINGRRKDSVRKIVIERVVEEIASNMNRKEIVDHDEKPTEYIDNFCDLTFTPFMDQPANDVNKLSKYPLYASNNQTYYREQLERGGLKSRYDISNWNQPFRKNCAFTTPPEDAFREPFGGF